MGQKFERYFSGEPVEPQTFPNVPAKEIAATGGVQEAQALADVGRGLMGISAVAMKWNIREGNSQFDTARREAGELQNEFELKPFADSFSHNTDYKKLQSDRKKLAPTNKSGARRFQSWLDLTSPGLDKMAAEKAIRGISRNNQEAYFKNLAAIVAETDFEKAQAEARLLRQGAIDDKSRTVPQANADYDKVMGDWLEADVWRRATTIVRPDGEVDWAAAVKWLSIDENIEGIDSEIIARLLNRVQDQAGAQKTRDDNKLNALQESQRDKIYALIEANSEDAIDTINDSALLAREKANLRKLAGNPAIPINYPEYDKVALIIDGVAKDTHTFKEASEAIAAGVGKHFGTTTAISLRTKLSANAKDDSPTKRPALTRGLTTIEEVLDAYIASRKKAEDFTFEDESRQLQEKQKMKNDLETYALSLDPADPTFDEKIEKKVQSLTKIPKEKVVLTWIERLWEGFIIGTGGRGFWPEKSKEISQPKTQAEYNDLPSGTIYIDTDGTRRKKK